MFEAQNVNSFFEFQFKSRDEKRRRTLRDPQPADVALGRLPTDEQVGLLVQRQPLDQVVDPLVHGELGVAERVPVRE